MPGSPQLRRQVRLNTLRTHRLLQDIRKDVTRLTENSKTLDSWMRNLSPYALNNPLTINGVKGEETQKLLQNILKPINYTPLPKGGTMELVKGIISENTMHYVTKMGEDMKTQLRKIAVEGYNQKLAPRDVAKQMSQQINGMSRSRAEMIARTETMRSSNLSNYVSAKEMGAKTFQVDSAPDCCQVCAELYEPGSGGTIFDIEDISHIPPAHPNCRCVAVFSVKTLDERS